MKAVRRKRHAIDIQTKIKITIVSLWKQFKQEHSGDSIFKALIRKNLDFYTQQKYLSKTKVKQRFFSDI